jgi:hypothetical protein
MEKINKTFGLGLIGFNEQQKEILSALLSLAESRLEHSWQIVNCNMADFFLFSTEKSQSESFIVKKNLPVERCLFCSEQASHANNELLVDTKKTPRLGSMIATLNQITGTQNLSNKASSDPVMAQQVDAIISTPASTPNSDNNSFNPEQFFLKHLLQNTAELFVCSFSSSAGNHKFYVDLAGKVYYGETGLKYLDVNEVSIHNLSQEEWDDALKQATLASRPLNNLIWYAAFKLSNGRLLRGHSSRDSIYLTRWPDLGVQECGRYVKLAAFMRNNAVCLTDVAEKTATPLVEVYNFYNACYLIGIVEKTEQSEMCAKVLDEDKQQLLARITNRLEKITSHEEG